MKPLKAFILSLSLLPATTTIFAQPHDSTVWMVSKTKDFILTGDGTAAYWNQTSWLAVPQRHEKSARRETKMKILYSDSGIYCLYFCEDTKITATLTADFADLFNEDVVEAFFWPDESTPIYFEYEVSPLNYELPILVPNIRGDFLGWRPWHYEGSRKTRHAVKINHENGKVVSWTAEFFIPFLLLKPLQNSFPKSGTRWRANFYRIDYDGEPQDWSWRQPAGPSFHDYERFGTLVFQ